MFKIKVPATSANMGPAFDTAGIALSLYNETEFYTKDEISFDGNFHIESVNNINEKISAKTKIPTDETNLIYATMKFFSEKVGIPLPPFYMKQVDEIPLARGLGSSSACIVTAVLAANKLTNANLSEDDLLYLAVMSEGHPDNVAPALLGNMVVGAVENSKFNYIKIPVPKSLEFITLIPDFSLSTSEARGVLPKEYERADVVFNCSRTALLTGAMLTENLDALSLALKDRIHQPYRRKLIPGMKEIFEKAEETGCIGSFLSGAGPTLMLVNKKGNDVISEIEKFTKTLDRYWLVKNYEIDTCGATITE